MHRQDTARGTLLVCLLALITVTHAAEKKITRAELPPAVEATVAEQSKGATLKGLSTETEGRNTFYEVELYVNGHGRDITIDAQGKIVEVEEEVPLASLSAAVKQALTAGAGTGTIGKVESLTKQGKLVAYEAVVTKGKNTTEIQVGSEGQKLKRPE